MENKQEEKIKENKKSSDVRNKIESLLKKLEWQDYMVAFLILTVCFLQFNIFSSMQSLPGPIYGGDVYLYYGHVNHIEQGGSMLESPQYKDEFPHLPMLYFKLVYLFGLIFGLSALKASVYFGIIATIISGILIYFIGKKIFDDKSIAMIFSFFWITRSIPQLSSSFFDAMVGIPLAYIIYFLIKKKNGAIYSAIIYGICAVLDIMAFLNVNLFLAVLIIADLLRPHISFDAGKLSIKSLESLKGTIIDIIKRYYLVFAIGIPLSFLFWYGPIIHYKLQILNPIQEYVSTGTGMFQVIKDTYENLEGTFLSFGNYFRAIWSLFAIIGIYGIRTLSKHRKEYNIAWLVLAVSMIGMLHPIITQPLIGTSFGHYGFRYVFPFAGAIFTIIGIQYISKFIKKDILKKAFYGAILILITITFVNVYGNYNDQDYVKMSKDISGLSLINFGEEIKQKIGVDEVILTIHPESGFFINALTGSKIMNYRRTHSNIYVDIEKRNAESAIILYSNNTIKTKELIEKYDISYFFIDSYTYKMTQDCITYWDALEQNPDAAYYCLTTKPEYEKELNANGIETKRVRMRLDPASAVAPRYDMIAIKPRDITIKRGKEIASIKQNDQVTYGLWELNR